MSTEKSIPICIGYSKFYHKGKKRNIRENKEQIEKSKSAIDEADITVFDMSADAADSGMPLPSSHLYSGYPYIEYSEEDARELRAKSLHYDDEQRYKKEHRKRNREDLGKFENKCDDPAFGDFTVTAKQAKKQCSGTKKFKHASTSKQD